MFFFRLGYVDTSIERKADAIGQSYVVQKYITMMFQNCGNRMFAPRVLHVDGPVIAENGGCLVARSLKICASSRLFECVKNKNDELPYIKNLPFHIPIYDGNVSRKREFANAQVVPCYLQFVAHPRRQTPAACC